MMARSTKGASRQRRELINAEINCIRDLLPLQEGVRKRLSQLQIMAICKAFIGKNNFFGKVLDTTQCSSDRAEFSSEFSQALPGFLLIATVDGKFLYLSDNIMEVLGNSMVDFITQAETIFDLFDEKGQAKVLELLSGGYHGNRSDAYATGDSSSSFTDEIRFTCLMGLTKNARRHPGLDRQKAMKVRASLMRASSGDDNSECVLVAVCTPWPTFIPTGEPMPVFNTMVYQTRHTLDMKFLNLDTNGEYHLGYSAKELQFRSYYELIHPDHEHEFIAKHVELISSGMDSFSSVFLRVQTRYGHCVWLHIIMRIIPGNDSNPSRSEIVCTNHVINEEELTFMREREQVEAEMAIYPASQDQMFSNTGNCALPYPAVVVDDSRCLVTPSTSSVGQHPVWREGNKRRRTEKADRYENQNVFTSMPIDDFSSSSSMSFHSPTSNDVDHSFQFPPMEAFPSTGCLEVVGQMDFNLQTEDHYRLNVPSPHSVFSDSAIGNSPRMFPEDEGSFFNSMSSVTDQTKISSSNNSSSASFGMNGSNTSLDDLFELRSCSDMQSISNELPELSISELNDYLNSMEDCKREMRVPQNFHNLTFQKAALPAYNYNHNVLQPNQASQVSKASSHLTYNATTVSRVAEANFTKLKPETTGLTSENVPCLTSELFLERLIESPQFTELIGMIETESQRFQGFHEQGRVSYG